MGLNSEYNKQSLARSVGAFVGFIFGKPITDAKAGFESMGHVGHGDRAAYERNANNAIGIKVEQGVRLNRIPLQVDAPEFAEAHKQSKLAGAFKRAKSEFKTGQAEGAAAREKVGQKLRHAISPPKPAM